MVCTERGTNIKCLLVLQKSNQQKNIQQINKGLEDNLFAFWGEINMYSVSAVWIWSQQCHERLDKTQSRGNTTKNMMGICSTFFSIPNPFKSKFEKYQEKSCKGQQPYQNHHQTMYHKPHVNATTLSSGLGLPEISGNYYT